MVRHYRLRAWEKQLKQVFDRIDDYLEDKYGGTYPLHPSRPPRGRTANKEADGLFRVGASFTAGFGSRYGRGYAVMVRMVTLSEVPEDVRSQIEDDVAVKLREALPHTFPGRELHVNRDGPIYKIYGDLSLGTL
jgi:hypothetical protein